MTGSYDVMIVADVLLFQVGHHPYFYEKHPWNVAVDVLKFNLNAERHGLIPSELVVPIKFIKHYQVLSHVKTWHYVDNTKM